MHIDCLEHEKNHPFFSIIMPCYNSELYLDSAVKSVLSQTYSNWELVLINDGSTDHTLKLLKNFANQDSRIKVFSKENGGYATAISEGLGKICGKYFLMMGSDDQLCPTLLEEIEKRACKTEPDIICFRTVKVRNAEVIDYADQITEEAFEQEITFKQIEEKYPVQSGILFERDTSKCYKTELLKGQRMLGKTGLDADGIFSMTFCHKIHSILFLPVVGYRWTLRSDSVSGRNFSVTANTDRLKNWNLFFRFLLKLPHEEICKKEYSYLEYVKKTISYYLPQIRFFDFRKFHLVRKINRKYINLIKKSGNSVSFGHAVKMRFVLLPQWFIRIKENLLSRNKKPC